MDADPFSVLASLDAALARGGNDPLEIGLAHLCELLPFHAWAIASFDPETLQPAITRGDAALDPLLTAAVDSGLFGLSLQDARAITCPLEDRLLVLLHCHHRLHSLGTLLLDLPLNTPPDTHLRAASLIAGRLAEEDHHRALLADVERRRHELEQTIARHAVDLAATHQKHEIDSLSKLRFLADMSHEIRTPMNGVLGMIQVLLGTPLSDEQQDYARTVQRSGEALITLLNDILDFSKIESGRLELERLPFNPVELCYDVVDLFRSRLPGGGVELVVEIDPSAPDHLEGDPTRLRQVLSNLVSNAVKFTAHGHILIRLAQEGERLRLEVADTGEGISGEALPRMFSPYQQADASVARRKGGTGLGLAISKSIVEASGGRIHVESVVGAGTCFTIDLPAPGATCPAPSERHLEGRRLLLIDDHHTSRNILRQQLEQLGAIVVEESDAQGGVAALVVAEALGEPYHGVLVDGHLPGGGIPLARRIRDEPGLGTPARLLLFPARPDEDLEPSLATVLLKPTRLTTLARIIRAALGDPLPKADHGSRRQQLTGHILLADDNAVNQRVGKLLLGQLGLSVDLASDGQEAVTRAAHGHYDLVLMDLQMPVLDGLGATRSIRQSEVGSDRHLPIIALTAAATAEDRAHAAEAGMDGYLTKPFREEDLRRLMERWLRATHCTSPG